MYKNRFRCMGASPDMAVLSDRVLCIMKVEVDHKVVSRWHLSPAVSYLQGSHRREIINLRGASNASSLWSHAALLGRGGAIKFQTGWFKTLHNDKKNTKIIVRTQVS
jgi:hypothetical protein